MEQKLSDTLVKAIDRSNPMMQNLQLASRFNKLVDEGGGDVTLEDNKAVTIDVSAYTDPVEVTPTAGKDGMRKVTASLSNIPSGSLPAPYCYPLGYPLIVFSGSTELTSVSEDGNTWYSNFELVQWRSDDLSFGVEGGRVVIQYYGGSYNVMAVVTPAGTENPSEQNWYEKSADSWNVSEDTTVDPSKTYYVNFHASYAKYSNGGKTYTVDFTNSWLPGPLVPDV